MRGEGRQFTHSEIIAWIAVDRSIRDAEAFGAPAPLDEWRSLLQLRGDGPPARS